MNEYILASITLIILLIVPLSLLINSTNHNFFLNIRQQAMATQAAITTKLSDNIPIDYITNTVMMTNPKEANFSVYENSIYGIKIDYPASWLKLEFNRNDLIAVFALPSEKKPLSERNVSEFILENLMIGIKTIASSSSSSSLSSSATSIPKNVLLNKFVNEQISSYKRALADFHIIASNTTGSIDNNPTYQVQYIHKNGPATFDTLQIWTIKGNSIYTIRFNADPADYPTYLPIIRKMTDSFVIFKNNNNNQI